MPQKAAGRRSLLAAAAYSLLLLLLAAIPPAAAEEQNWGRGPVEMDDQFPLALIHSTILPSSPRVGAPGELTLRGAAAWTNTLNAESRLFTIDSEVRTFNIGMSYVAAPRTELSLSLPVVWRGGGVLDHAIYEWHSFWGLPQGPRDNQRYDDDEYAITAETLDGDTADLPARGTKFGDLQLGIARLLTSGDSDLPAVRAALGVRLPSGAEDYGQDGFDLTARLDVAKRYGSWIAYGGVGNAYYSDAEENAFEFHRNHFGGFLSLEYDAFEDWSPVAALAAGSGLVKNVSHLPEYQIYLDVGIKWMVLKGGGEQLGHERAGLELELLLRENPAPQDGTADVSLLLGLNWRMMTAGARPESGT